MQTALFKIWEKFHKLMREKSDELHHSRLTFPEQDKITMANSWWWKDQSKFLSTYLPSYHRDSISQRQHKLCSAMLLNLKGSIQNTDDFSQQRIHKTPMARYTDASVSIATCVNVREVLLCDLCPCSLCLLLLSPEIQTVSILSPSGAFLQT